MSWSQLYEEHLATILAQAMRISELETALLSIRTIAEIAQQTNMVGTLHNHIEVIRQRADVELLWKGKDNQ